MQDRSPRSAATSTGPELLVALSALSVLALAACDPVPVRVCRSSADCLASEICLGGTCLPPDPCRGDECPQPLPPDICREDRDCARGGTCEIRGCPACAPGSECECFGECVYPTDPCAGADERTCSRTPGCTPIYASECGRGRRCLSDVGCDDVCELRYSHCERATCGQIGDARRCEARPECDWVKEPVACAPCYCDPSVDGGCECPPCPESVGRCVPSTKACPDVCAEICAGRPEPFIPDGCPIPDCACPSPPPPPPACREGEQYVDGRCVRGCYHDGECGAGERCNAAEVCLPPPGCDVKNGEDVACPAVCYGTCEPDPSTCYGLDPSTCIATAPCELVAVPEDCETRDCVAYYECRPTSGRACEGLNEQECSSREDCEAGRCGACPDGAACICAEGAFLGCFSRKPEPCAGAWLDETGTCRSPVDGVYPDECCASRCQGLGEAQCRAASPLCRTLYAGGQCTCDETGACSCQELRFERCTPR